MTKRHPAATSPQMRACLALIATTAATALAAGSPENALLVVNGDSWASMWIANEYAAARQFPQASMVILHDLPSFETTTVADFREKILLPALKLAEQRGIAPYLDYVLYSADLPWAVDVTADMAGRTFPKPITQPASLTGLTFLYQFVLAKNPQYLGLNTNLYFRTLSRVAPEAPWPAEETARYEAAVKSLQQISERAEAARSKAEADAKAAGSAFADPSLPDAEKTELRAIRDTLLVLAKSRPKTTELSYNLACVHARLGDTAAALTALRTAMANGWWDMRHAAGDADLRPLWSMPDFKALATEAKNVKYELTPTSGFRGSVGWQPGGAPVAADKGVRYLLSTMLACTSGRGLSPSEAVANLRRSVAADGTRPRGTVYFMENGDVRSTTREWAFARTAEKLRELGIVASIETGVLPAKETDVAGAVIGTADFDWTASGSRILPGAIVEHLTSFGGAMGEGAGQTPLTEFLRHGAAGASGTVTEPYAIQAKFPSPFIHWHYAQGATLAEAFYQSVAGPYQLLIVGDAFCTPWKKRITITADGIKPGETLRGSTTIQPAATSPDDLAISHFEMFFDGTRVGAVKPGGGFTFDTAKAADGAHEVTLLAIASDPLATTARLTVPVTISNAGRTPIATSSAAAEWPWDKPLELSAKADGAKGIIFAHHARQVAQVDGSEGSATLDPRLLGPGPATLRPIAIYPDGTQAIARPITLKIIPPAPRPGLEKPPAPLSPGLHVIPSGLPATVVEKSGGDWLEKAGVRADGEFAIEAWFRVESEDTYQFQLHGPRQLRLFVDGAAADWPRGREWWHIPVHLAPGWHTLRIEGKAEGKPRLDARFGGPGTRKLAAPRFQVP